MSTYLFKKIEDAREDLIGAKLTDFTSEGKVLFLENKEGRPFTIDCTGKNGAVVHAHNTEKEEFELLQSKFNALLEKLGIYEDELWKPMEE